ncbi:MAG: VWA domain-containing protein, partial [Candidatus Riflebacteria bacterium]|nr:VWA domain-containing protein [Candidatus Riflebacteria bacterium]
MKNFKLFILILFLFTVINQVEGAFMTSMAGDIPLVAQKINVIINNQIATTKIEMSFYNQYSYTVQPNFKFPIHESASVQKFSLTDSLGNVFEGKIGEKEEVKSSFDNAVAESVMPAMAVQQKSGVFETAIGSIGPKSNASVILEYCEILPYQSGKVAYVMPLSMQDYRQARNVDSISANIEIKDEKSIVGVDTSLFSFPVNVERVNENAIEIVFELSNLRPERNFVISYELKADKMVSNLITTRPNENEDGYFLLIVSPQEVFSQEDVAKRDIVFVVDVSGSMSGEKLTQTKKAFEFFINRLNSDDRFNIISFDKNVYSFNSGLLPLNPVNKESGINYIRKLRAGSTTNINQALLDALSNFSSEEKRTKAVIFLTDGEPCGGITNISQICQNINNANNNDIRLFCVGIGRRLNTTLLNKLALENRGETLFIDESKSEIDSELMAFYKGISTPLLVDPILEWEGIKVTEVYP